MERRSGRASFNGSLYPMAHLGEPLASSYLSHETPRATHDHRIGRRVDGTELNVFDAERYFREGDDAAAKQTSRHEFMASSVDVFERNGHGRSDSCLDTPTASSEASWNSKSGLLYKAPDSAAVTVRASPVRDPRRPRASGSRWLFRCSCPCSGEKSVDVEERHFETKSPSRSSMESDATISAKKQSYRTGEVRLSSIPERVAAEEHKNEFDVEEVTKVKITPGNWGKDRSFFHVANRFSPEKTIPTEIGHRIMNPGKSLTDSSGFSFPILCPPSSNLAEEPPRDSLEVFRPTDESTKMTKKPSEFQRRATVLPFPAERDSPSFTYPASPKPHPEDDAASDESSDLFEIQSLSTQMTYRHRDSLDELEGRRFVGSGAAAGILQLRRSLEGAAAPSIAPSECYQPSEASVEWSVTTAEGFDHASAANFSSAASNYDEFRFIEEEHNRFAAALGGAPAGPRRKGNGLLDCRSEKAVSVGPSPVRIRPPVDPDVVPRVTNTGRAQERPGRPVQKH
ncbi:hypothetical protein C4D60_Mb10t23860 [Musa balbisiana]|uniref:Uncharacterized protein n=1 Tax=Musa balbisiana TaxID=52838 RepID=A0A4S8J1U3_MUSBA|nr:hypothetical protein C4D60_Mb10t23860 [Musa balbisiana]